MRKSTQVVLPVGHQGHHVATTFYSDVSLCWDKLFFNWSVSSFFIHKWLYSQNSTQNIVLQTNSIFISGLQAAKSPLCRTAACSCRASHLFFPGCNHFIAVGHLMPHPSSFTHRHECKCFLTLTSGSYSSPFCMETTVTHYSSQDSCWKLGEAIKTAGTYLPHT